MKKQQLNHTPSAIRSVTCLEALLLHKLSRLLHERKCRAESREQSKMNIFIFFLILDICEAATTPQRFLKLVILILAILQAQL